VKASAFGYSSIIDRGDGANRGAYPQGKSRRYDDGFLRLIKFWSLPQKEEATKAIWLSI
jgi:hypothetical protein